MRQTRLGRSLKWPEGLLGAGQPERTGQQAQDRPGERLTASSFTCSAGPRVLTPLDLIRSRKTGNPHVSSRWGEPGRFWNISLGNLTHTGLATHSKGNFTIIL